MTACQATSLENAFDGELALGFVMFSVIRRRRA
jgi:hypothetical protein